MPAGGHFPLARSRGRQPQPPSVSVRLPVRWFRQWGPGHVASLTQHCFRGSPSGSGQHSVPPDVRVAFRCSVGQLCWPVHPSAHVGSRPPPAAAPCCPSPRSPGSACRPEGAGRAAAPAGSPPGWKPVSHRHAAAPRRHLRACVSPHGRPAAPWPGPGLSFGGPNRSAALTGGLFILGRRVCVRGVQARFPGSRCPTLAWLGGWRVCATAWTSGGAGTAAMVSSPCRGPGGRGGRPAGEGCEAGVS